MKRLALFVLGWPFLLTTAESASFDCGKAGSKVEKLICGDAQLSKLDEDLNEAYLRSIERSDVKQSAIHSQRQWLKNARNVCKNKECIKAAYETRITELGFTSSFGIVFLRPSGRNTSPDQTSDKGTEPKVKTPPMEVPKIGVGKNQVSASAADCGVSNIPASPKIPQSQLVTKLVETARAKVEQQQIECAVQTLAKANRIVHSVADGTERAAMGFEIKDVALDIIQQEKSIDPATETRLIEAATQSIDATGKPVKNASEDERINDTAFLGYVSDHYNRQARNAEYRQIDLTMLRLNFSLPASTRWAEQWRLTNFLGDQQRKNYFEEVLELLEGAQDDVHQTYRTEFLSGMNQAAGGHMLSPLSLLSADNARRDLRAITQLSALFKEETLSWQMYLYLAESYWQVGNKAKAREYLAKARSTVAEGSSLFWIAKFLCNKSMTCPFGIYDSKEMASLLDAVEGLAGTDRFIKSKMNAIQAMRNSVSRGEAR